LSIRPDDRGGGDPRAVALGVDCREIVDGRNDACPRHPQHSGDPCGSLTAAGEALGIVDEHKKTMVRPVLDWSVGQIDAKIANALEPFLASAIIFVSISLIVDGNPAVVRLHHVFLSGQFLKVFPHGLAVKEGLLAQP